MATQPTEDKAVFAYEKSGPKRPGRRALAFLCYDLTAEADAGQQFLTEVRHATHGLSIEDCSIAPWSPHDDWLKQVQGKIGRCDLMIVLVGPGTGSSQAVEQEIRMAKKTNLPFFGVRLPAAEATDCLSIGLPPNRIVAYNWDAIDSAVAQLLTEGKHHKFV